MERRQSAQNLQEIFQPPEWSVFPNEATAAAKFLVYRDSQLEETILIGTKCVFVFGRDASTDTVLKNPSTSRHHAAIFHDSEGGIYIVDLKSRHGTFVGKKKIPANEPTLIHAKQIIRFGQSSRKYILADVDPKGKSVAARSSFKLKAPNLAAKLPTLRRFHRYPQSVNKLVNTICCSGGSEESLKTFTNSLNDLGEDELRELIYALLDKIKVKFNLYASQLAAVRAIGILIENKVGLEIISEHIRIIVKLSQSRHDNNLRTEARQVLKSLAFAHVSSSSDDAKTTFSTRQYENKNEKDGSTDQVDEKNDLDSSSVDDHSEFHSPLYGKKSSSPSPEDSETSEEDEEEIEEISINETQESNNNSGFSFIACDVDNASPSNQENTGTSAFSFIKEESESVYDYPNEHKDDNHEDLKIFSDFLSSEASMSQDEFESFWLTAKQSNDWNASFIQVPTTEELKNILEPYSIFCLASGKIGGTNKLLFYAKEASNGTIFMCEMEITGSANHLSVTVKWREMDLLYENSHEQFVKMLKLLLKDICETNEVETTTNAASVEDVASILKADPYLDPKDFEQLWPRCSSVGTWTSPLKALPQAGALEQHLMQMRISCLASGTIQDVEKFYFYAQSSSDSTLFMIAVTLHLVKKVITADIKAAQEGIKTKEAVDTAYIIISLFQQQLIEFIAS